MAQIPPIDDAYINEIIKSNGPYNPALLTTQGLKMRELIKWLRDRMEQGDTEAVHKTGDETISGTKTFTLIKAEGLSVNNLADPSLDTVISPVTGIQTKLLNITEGAFGLQLSASVLAASRSQLLQDKDGIIALTSDLAAFPTLSQLDTGLASKIDISEKGVPGGVSTLDSGGKIFASQLPDSISGALTYQGTWDAVTNTPALANPPASSTKGYYYVTNTAGTQFGITFAVGDWIVSNGTAWEKVDNSDAVTTVFGRLGNIFANEADYSAFYPLLNGSYANPSWITSLPYSKITGTPSLSGYELLANKQNSLTTDGTGVKYPTVDAVNAALANANANIYNTNGTLTGSRVLTGIANNFSIDVRGTFGALLKTDWVASTGLLTTKSSKTGVTYSATSYHENAAFRNWVTSDIAPLGVEMGTYLNQDRFTVGRRLAGEAHQSVFFTVANIGKIVLGGDAHSNSHVTRAIGGLSVQGGLLAETDDIEVSGSAKGIILKSPDGTRYRVTVANGGTLTAIAL